MSKSVFVKFVSEPKNDTLKTIVGIACVAQAINDGHDVSVFFAASGTRLLDRGYIEELDNEIGADSKMVSRFMDAIISKATLFCSFASVKAGSALAKDPGAEEPVDLLILRTFAIFKSFLRQLDFQRCVCYLL